MRLILGIIGIIASIILGVYVGVFVCFIGGVIGCLTALGALLTGKLLVGLITVSIAKMIFAGIAGWASFALLFLPSWAMIAGGK